MDRGVVGSGGMVHGGVAVAMTVSASTSVGVDEGHKGQDCREGLHVKIDLWRIRLRIRATPLCKKEI